MRGSFGKKWLIGSYGAALYFFFTIVVCLSSCGRKHDKLRGAAIARAGGEYLYEKDLTEAMPKGLKQEDSIQFRESFITSWIKEVLMYRTAEKELVSKEKNKDKELHEYYRSLLRQELLKKELSKKMDRRVTDQEIQAYYNENRKNFELKRNIIRFLYIKLPTAAPDIASAKEWIKVHDRKSMDNLLDYARKYARNYNLDTTAWYYFDDITKEIPVIEYYNPEHFIKDNNYVELRDASYFYFLNVIDNRIKDDMSPLYVVKGRIRNIILNIRQVKEVQQLENEVYKNAAREGSFEVY